MQFARRHESRGICYDGSGGADRQARRQGENEAKRMADCLAVQRPTLPPSFIFVLSGGYYRIERGEEAEEERKCSARSANFLLLFVRWMDGSLDGE